MLTPALQRDDGWLLYAASAPAACAPDAEALLAWSSELPGGCKFARAAAGAALRVQAELPALAECAERTAQVEAGFAAAAARLGLGAAASSPLSAQRELFATPARGDLALSSASASPLDLAALCREAGWPFEPRSDGSLAVDLAVAGAYVPALVEARGERVAVEVELVRWPGAEGACRAALAALLLRVNGAFRMTRAVLRAAEARALLEVSLPYAPRAGELGEALAAMAVAAQRSALEARLLASDAAFARTFLERSGSVPLA